MTAEEAYFADSVRYTAMVCATRGCRGVNFSPTTGNVLGPITVTGDGWNARIANVNLTNPRMVCAIFIGSTSIAPAMKEGEPKCAESY